MARKPKVVDTQTGDVFVDIGFADAGERRLRVQLAMQFNELLADRRLTQAGFRRFDDEGSLVENDKQRKSNWAPIVRALKRNLRKVDPRGIK